MKLGLKRYFQLNNCRYAHWISGKGPLVVLLHGWPVTSHHWRLVVPKLNAAGFSTLCIVLRRLGESRCKADERFQKKDLAEDIKKILNLYYPHNGIYAVLGHDWGGSIALALASIDRTRVRAVVIEEEIPPGIEVEIPKPGAIHYPKWHGAFHRSTIAEHLITKCTNKYIDYFLNLRANSRSLEAKDRRAYLRFYKGALPTKIGLSYYRAYNEDAAFFQTLSKKKLSFPLLALGGYFAMGTAVGKSMERIANHVDSFIFKKSGHYPSEEEPDLFALKVIAFLKKYF